MDGILLSDLEEYARVRYHLGSLLPLPWQEWCREVMSDLEEQEYIDAHWALFALPVKIPRAVEIPH